MNFSDNPEEAAFRASAREWLDANATLRDGSEKAQDHFMELRRQVEPVRQSRILR